jgi:hypothetical protein
MDRVSQVSFAAAELADPPRTPASSPLAPATTVDRAALCAPLLLSALLVVLDNAACWRIPWRELIPWLVAPVLIAVAVWLLIMLRLPGRNLLFVFGIILAALAVYFPLAAFFGRWLPDPVHGITQGFDDWCYQALGDYLFNNHRGRVGGMSMIDEFGAHLQNTRFSTAGVLEFLQSGVGIKDPPMSHFVLGVVCLAVHFSSMFYLGRALFASSLTALAAAFLATAAGWMSDVLTLGSYDNLLFVALIPALIGVLIRLEPSASPFPWLAVAGGLLLAAVLEAYPEGVPLLGVMLVPLTVFLVMKCVARPALLWRYLGVIGIGLALSSPYLPIFRTFLLFQIRGSVGPTLPGSAGNFAGLLDDRRLPAFFAMGDEWTGFPYNAWHNVIPLILIALLVAGALSARKAHPWFPLAALAVGLLLVWQDELKKFDYGTYKVLVCSAWWIYLGIAAGLAFLVRSLRLPAWSMMLFLGVLASAIGWGKYEERILRSPLPTSYMGPLRELTSVRFVTQQKPLLLDIDDFNYIWAVYYLRHLPITTFKQRGALSMPHLVPWLAQGSSPPPGSALFVLVTGNRPDAVWSTAKFSVLPMVGAYVESPQGPNEIEHVPGGVDYVWVGAQPEIFPVQCISAGNFELRATDLGIGPRAPHQNLIAFEITDPSGTHRYEWAPGGSRSFPVHLNAGENLVSVRCLESPLPAPAGGDQRETMFQIRGYSVAAVP